MKKFKEIDTFIFDIDGVLTDGSIFINSDSDQLRTMNTKDGYALLKAKEMGYNIAIITGGNSKSVINRFEKLGITDVYLNSSNKIEQFEKFCYNKSLNKNNILYMGDDIPDYNVMKQVGLSACPKDAVDEIISISNYISDKNGGCGCVRDVIKKVMISRGDWPKL